MGKMKKLILSFIAILFIIAMPFSVNANETNSYDLNVTDSGGDTRNLKVSYEGLVPCGRCLDAEGEFYSLWLDDLHNCDRSEDETYIPCDLCHGFIIFDHIISFFLGTLIPIAAMIVIIISGILLMTTGWRGPDKVNKVKKALTGAVIGIVISVFSWAIVTVLIASFMHTDYSTDLMGGGFEINHICNLEIEEFDIN